MMLNFYYLYTMLWGGILALYFLGWSDFNQPLESGTWLFFTVTMLLSLLIGTIRRKKLAFFRTKEKKHNHTVTGVVTLLFVIDFIYSREIPLISIAVFHSSEYMSFQGIPVIHVFLITVSAVYALYLFYLAVNTDDRRMRVSALIDWIVILSMYFLMFYRGMILMIGFSSLLLYLTGKKKRITIGQWMIVLLTSLLVLYLFGVLGNIRSGIEWDDNRWIEQIGKYNDEYPAFLPKQFMWAYSYITSPISNLNHSIRVDTISGFDYKEFAFSVIPDVISNYLKGGADDFWSTGEKYSLVAEYFNACTGYIDSYYAGGIPGMFLCYFIQIMSAEITLFVCRKSKYYTVALASICMIIVFSFFNNTLTYSAMSLQLLVIIFMRILERTRLRLYIL